MSELSIGLCLAVERGLLTLEQAEQVASANEAILDRMARGEITLAEGFAESQKMGLKVLADAVKAKGW